MIALAARGEFRLDDEAATARLKAFVERDLPADRDRTFA